MSFFRSVFGAPDAAREQPRRPHAAASSARSSTQTTIGCAAPAPPLSAAAAPAPAPAATVAAPAQSEQAPLELQGSSGQSAGVLGMFAGLSLKADTLPRPYQSPASPTANREHSPPKQSESLLSMLNSLPADDPDASVSFPDAPSAAILSSQSAFSFLRSDPEPTQAAAAPSFEASVDSPETGVSVPSSFGFLSQKSGTPLSRAYEEQPEQELARIEQPLSEEFSAREPHALEYAMIEDGDSGSTLAEQAANQTPTEETSHDASQFDDFLSVLMAKPTTATRSQSAPSPLDFISLESVSKSQARAPSPAEAVRSQSDKVLEESIPQQAAARNQQQPASPDVSPVDATFKSLQLQFGEFMLQHWRVLREVSAQKSTFLRDIGKAADSISLLRSEVSLLESQQGRAVESEQYELADELDSELKQKRQEVESLENAIKELRKSFDDCDSRVQDQRESIQNRSEQFIADLEQFQEHSMQSMRDYVREQQEQIGKQDLRLKEELSRFEKMMSIISTDLDRVEAAHADIDRSIRERTQAEHEEKDKLLQAQHHLDQELQQLRQLVAEKEAGLKKLQVSLSEAESKIEQARTSYSRQLHRLSERRERVLNEKSEMESERSEAEAKQAALDRTKQEVQHHEKHVEEVCSEVSKRMEATRLMVSSLHSYESDWLACFKQERNLHELVECASGKVAQETRSIQALRSRQSLLREDMSVNKDNIESVKRQLPDLQSKKKDAVASRDFKAASKISKQIKALQMSLEQSQESLENGDNVLSALAKDIEASEVELEKCQRGQREAQKNLDQYRFHTCLNRRSKLRQLLVWATQVEKNSLLEDIEEAEAEAAALGKQYCWTLPPIEEDEENHPTQEVDVPEEMSDIEARSERVDILVKSDEEKEQSLMGNSSDDGMMLQIRALEEELEAAIEADEFDLAESLHERITALQSQYDSSIHSDKANELYAHIQCQSEELSPEAEAATSATHNGSVGQEEVLSQDTASTEQVEDAVQDVFESLSDSESRIDQGQEPDDLKTIVQTTVLADVDQERDCETEERLPHSVHVQTSHRDDDESLNAQNDLADQHERDSLGSASQSEDEYGADEERHEHQDMKQSGVALDSSTIEVADATSLSE